MRWTRDQKVFGGVFLAPALVLFSGFVAVPSVRALLYSLQKWDGLTTPEWAGLGNFAAVLQDRELFFAALSHNLILMLVGGALTLIISLFFAAVLHRRIRGAALFRVAFFFPNVISAVAIALLWLLLYSTTDFGVINGILARLHLGDSQIRARDIPDPVALAVAIRQGHRGSVGRRIRQRLNAADDGFLRSLDLQGDPDVLREALAGGLNRVLMVRDFYQRGRWPAEHLTPRSLRRIDKLLARFASTGAGTGRGSGPGGEGRLSETAVRLIAERGDRSFDTAELRAYINRIRRETNAIEAALEELTDKEVYRLNRRIVEDAMGGRLRRLRRPLEAAFRLAGIDWLKTDLPFPFVSKSHLIYSIIPMMVWTAIGFYMVLFLAAMESIPETFYEAAKLDGASAFAQFRHITLPLIREVLTVGIVFLVIGSLKFFDAVWVMDNEWPSKDTHVLATLLYQKVFNEYNVGYGSAVAVLLFVLVFAATLVTLRLSRREALEY